jgi:dCMP deaminase
MSDRNQRLIAHTVISQRRYRMKKSREVRFILSAIELAKIWSKDPSSKVCAIAVGKTHNLVAFGYNGFPPGIADTDERLNDREMKLRLTIHAEVNALTNAWFEVETLYCTHHPCDKCAPRIIAERTIKRIVYLKNEDYENRWIEDITFAKSLFRESNIELIEIESVEGV